MENCKSSVPRCGGSGYCNCWKSCEDLRRTHGGRIQDQEADECYLKESIKKWRTLFNNHLSTRTKKNKPGVSPLQVHLQQPQVRDRRAAEERKIAISRWSQRWGRIAAMGWQHGQTPNNTEEGLRERMTSQAMSLVKIILFDENNASMEGNDLLLDGKWKLHCPQKAACSVKLNYWASPENTSPPGKCSTLPHVRRTIVNFLRILNVSDKLISRENLQFGTGVQ